MFVWNVKRVQVKKKQVWVGNTNDIFTIESNVNHIELRQQDYFYK